VALSLTFVNQVGAVNGMNQAAPGSFIPETFVRWSQDVLYDRVGYLRRRAPYSTLKLFNETGTALAQPNADEERVIGVVNTRNPNNENVLGIVVTDGTTTRVLFYDKDYRKTCFCEIASVRQDTVVFSRPALNGGVFIGLLENYGVANPQNKNLLYYWRGGTGTGGYAIDNATLNVRNADIITTNYLHSGSPSNRFETSTPHNLQLNYIITVTATNGAFTLNDQFVVTAINGDTQFLAVRLNPTGSLPNTNINNVTFVVAGHVTHTNTITGTFDTTKITPGMFAYRVVDGTYNSGTNTITGGTDYYLGIVKQRSATTVTLEKDIIRTFGLDTSLYGVNTNQQVRFVNIRPYIHNHGRGLITKTAHGLTVTSGTIGSEGEGHFASAELAASPGWALYRASDGEWLGDVQSVTNNAALTLDSVYHTLDTAMNADEYVARPYRSIYFSPSSPDADKYTGCFNTTYAGYQWYGNGGASGTENRIVFSAYHDPESVDLSRDAADSIVIPGTQQMRGIATSSSGLVVFLEDKTYLLRGNYRANFSLEELYPEGCLSAQSIVEYGGGVFWASKNGILFYDGATVRNLTEANLGSYYTDSIKTFDALERRIYGFFYKDYLFMTFSGFASNYTPLRYEPIYADGITTTPAISDFTFGGGPTSFAVTNKALTSGVATLTLASNPFNQNDFIEVSINDPAFDGKFIVTSVSGNNILYDRAGSDVTSSTASGVVEFVYDDDPVWDEDFAPEDFLVENNVPVYWDSYRMYTSAGASGQNTSGLWASGASYPDADLTINDATVTNLTLDTYEIIDTSLTNDVATIEIDVTDTNRFPDGKHFIKVGNVIRVDIDSGGDTTFEGDDFVVTAITDTTVSYDLVNTDIAATGDAGDIVVAPGQYVIGFGVVEGATVLSITSATEIEMSDDATATSYGYTAYDADPLNNIPRSSFQIINEEPANTWGKSLQFVWGPVNFIEGMTFAIYLPTNAITAISNFDFRGFIKLDSAGGTRGYAGINAVDPDNLTGTYARLIDVDSMLNPINNHTTTLDSELSENLGKQLVAYNKGPDFYLQTKHFTVGDPVLKKWFRQIMLNLYLLDGGICMDVVDMEDNDRIDIQKKRHRNWELFEEATYSWNDLETIIFPKISSPNRSTWQNIQDLNQTWYKFADSEFTRRKKKISWRYPSAGFRLYQMNDYRPSNYPSSKRPHTVIVDSWNIGFKPMRASRG
jgi:hypothetical protein